MGLLVTLVRTHNPGNLGSAARAARNFGAALALIEPRCDLGHPDALAFASGAEALLSAAAVLGGWGELERRADRIVALTSLRGRATRGLPPPTTWSRVRTDARDHQVALVFGPERGGLRTDELSRCDARLSLPAVPDFPTLNLAQAVASALALSRGSGRTAALADGAAPSRELNRLLARWRQLLAGAGYPARGHSSVLEEIDAFLRRGRPTSREVTLLLGALAALQRRQP